MGLLIHGLYITLFQADTESGVFLVRIAHVCSGDVTVEYKHITNTFSGNEAMGSVIDQRANFRAEFGSIFRSSAIFYKPEQVKTTISVSNYWDFKNQVEVGVVLTQRTMAGEVFSRTEHRFEGANVLNMEIDELSQGSVEIESFSSRNLRIPYSAVMAVYETDSSVTMVHSYGRNHSLIELEDNKSLTLGRESCWTIRSSASIRNQAVFHNGHVAVPAQTGQIILGRQSGEERHYDMKMPVLKPFETHVFDIGRICPDYRQFLDGNDGWATVHFENSTAFTRLLILWQDPKNNQFQVTHSNFDYTDHQTNMIASTKSAYMKLPEIDRVGELTATVYPRFMPGSYEAQYGKEVTGFSHGLNLTPEGRSIEFRRLDGALPARIVTGIIGNQEADCLPFECSLGVIHDQRPPKRFHWAIVSRRLCSRIYVTDYSEIYDPGTQPIELVISLYNARNKDIATANLCFATLEELPTCLDPAKIFAAELDILGDDFGYVSIFSHYGGLLFYSSMEKFHAFTLEHSF